MFVADTLQEEAMNQIRKTVPVSEVANLPEQNHLTNSEKIGSRKHIEGGYRYFIDPEKNEVIVTTGLRTESYLDQLRNRVFNQIQLPFHWREEGVAAPNLMAKENASKLINSLFLKADMMPTEVSASKEGGVFVSYVRGSFDTGISLIFEIYNTGEIAALVNNNSKRKILLAEDIKLDGWGGAFETFSEMAG